MIKNRQFQDFLGLGIKGKDIDTPQIMLRLYLGVKRSGERR
jgi:hypothetical protein